MKSMMKRTTLREIKHSLGRYLAIFAIVALGVGFFSGLKVCKPSMVKTGDIYFRDTNFFDYRLLSTLGFEREDAKAFEELNGVQSVATSVSVDVICVNDDGTERVLAAHTLLDDINRLKLIAGRLPEKTDECVLDANVYSQEVIGTKIVIADSNTQDTIDQFAYDSYTVVGIAQSPYYLNYERGNTNVGNGKVSAFMYLLRDGFDTEYETELFIRMDQEYEIYSKAYKDYIDAHKGEIESVLNQIANNRYETIQADAHKEITDAEKELEDGKRELQDARDTLESETAEARKELSDALEKLQDGDKQIADGKKEIESGERAIQEGFDAIASKEKELSESLSQVEEAIKSVEPYVELSPEYKAQYEGLLINKAQIADGQVQLSNRKEQLQVQLQNLQIAKNEIANEEIELAEGYQEYYDGITELEEKIADAKREIADAEIELQDGEQELADARAELADLEQPSTYCLGRDTNTGYVCFDNDTSIVDDIASVFPVFFFAVAALVCMTTMTRMVEDQRTQIGVLKALGYSNARIVGKYMFYSGSAAISGAIVGYLFFCYVFPKVIWIAYGMMYGFAELTYVFPPIYAIISLIAALACSMGATFLSCASQFLEVPANLIRPKAPKAGKRIFLEYIGFIWKRLKFLRKVSIRNVFRYKKRFIMMVLGISGCTALLLTGLGLSDSMKGVLKDQYDRISTYDVQISLSEKLTPELQKVLEENMSEYLESYAIYSENSMDVISEKSTNEAYICIPYEIESFQQKYHLMDHKTEEEIPFPKDGEIVLTEKIAQKLGVSVGDTIQLSDADLNSFSVRVSGICKNHVYDYGFITADTYSNAIHNEPEYQSVFADFTQTYEMHEAAAIILDMEEISNLSLNEDFIERFDNMIKSLDYIIIMVIICAAALAFIVLYNLTNINITERIREIATIKVLGFYPLETASYVFRENIILTAFGTLLGLVLGKCLHMFVMYKIDVALIHFGHRLDLSSFLWSVVLTFIFAAFVNVVMYFKLEKINMAESLKSIE